MKPFNRRAQNTSSYDAPKTAQQVADGWAQDLIEQAQSGEISKESPYSEQKFKAVQYLVAGGGPTCEVTFVLDTDGDVEFATIGYYDADGAAYSTLHPTDAQPLWEAFQRRPREEQIEVTDGS